MHAYLSINSHLILKSWLHVLGFLLALTFYRRQHLLTEDEVCLSELPLTPSLAQSGSRGAFGDPRGGGGEAGRPE